MRKNEYNLQVSCVEWFRLVYSDHIIYHVPNGERRDAITGARLKRGGVLAGVPDLVIPYALGGYTHLYIELKNGTNGRLSPSQKAVIEELRKGGAAVVVVHSFDEFRSVVNAYFAESLPKND